MKGHRWKTPGNTLRRFDLRDPGSLRQSVLEVILDGLWAHEALTDGMLDGTDDSSEENTSEEDTADETADSEVIDEDLDDEDLDDEESDDEATDHEGPDHEAIDNEDTDDETLDGEDLDDEGLEDEGLEYAEAGDEDTDEEDSDDKELHDGYTDDDNADDKDLDIDDLPDCIDFFNLANKAFLLCFGDQVSIDPGELTNRAGFETHYLKTGINAARHQDIHNRTWQCEMFNMSLHILLALAHSHSSWFNNQPVRIWNQSITIKRPNDTYRFLDKKGSEELNFDPRINPPVILLTPLEKAFWQRQHNALKPNYKVNDLQSYTFQIRSLLDIIRISVQAHNSSFEYPFHTTRMFNTASQALHRIRTHAESYFGTSYNPLRNQAFNPESESRPFPARNQRQWAILNALDNLYRCRAGDEKRLIWAELVFGYAAGAAFTILPHEGSCATNGNVYGPEERVDLPAMDPRTLCCEEMLAFTHFALVGVGQFLVEKFEGRSLRLWSGEEIPKTREQEMVMWIGFLEYPDGCQPRLIPGVVCCR